VRYYNKYLSTYGDKMINSQNMQGKLSMMAKWDLKVDMSKGLQTSNWGEPILTTAQYRYAGYDGYVTWELFKMWRDKMNAGHWNGFHLINNAWRANLEMQGTALFLDVDYHQKNIDTWRLKRDTGLKYFERFTPKSIIANIASNKQVSNFLKAELAPEVIEDWPKTGKTKDLILEQAILKKVAIRLPYPMNRWMAALVIVRYYNKYLSTYGDKMINSQNMQGKLSTKFNMAAAITCRYSSSSHNLQNIPRKEYVRKAFTVRAGKREVMVLADYSGIEVRVAAEISGDAKLLNDTIYGNVHGTGAARIHGVEEKYFLDVLADKTHPDSNLYKSYRQDAKVFTFRLLYGAGVGALADSLKMNNEQAQVVVNNWAEAYKSAYLYRFEMQKLMMKTGYLPVVDGRTIYVRKADRQLPVAANYPIQSAAASVMYAAVAEVRKELVERDLDASLAACVHDEILMYAHTKDADAAHEALNVGMKKGWLAVFPNSNTDNLGESAIGRDWSAKP
jgi:DNA polymerase-1